MSAPTLDLGLYGDGIDHDPINPHHEFPTPPDLLARLTRPQREERVLRLIDIARDTLTHAEREYGAGKDIVARCILYSGGNDSTTLAHLFRDVATHAIHANTGIGVEETRQFVRDTSAAWGLPLIEERPNPEDSYEALVLDQGFPGPAHHWKMYQRLKERCLDKARHTLGVANSRTKRAVYIAGRRRMESKRREDIPLHEADGSVIWASPLAVWHKADLQMYRLMHDVPTNPVSEALGMSGECLCLAYAQPGERARVERLYAPDIAVITVLEEKLRDRTDIPDHRKTWGWGAYYDSGEEPQAGRLCDSCGVDPLLELMDPLFDLGVAS